MKWKGNATRDFFVGLLILAGAFAGNYLASGRLEILWGFLLIVGAFTAIAAVVAGIKGEYEDS